jgi:hypothetical protein
MKRALVFFIVGVVFFGVCSAQSANAQNANIAQRIIGTWVSQAGHIWIFKADGTLTIGSTECRFGVTDTHLVIVPSDVYGTTDAFLRDTVYIISISSDGRTLIGFLSGDNGIWLTKR